MSNEDHLEKLKKEIATLEESKFLLKKAAEGRLEQLQALADHFRTINEGAPNALGKLSKVLGSALSDRNIGVMVVGHDGKVLLFNSAIQRLVGLHVSESAYLSRGIGFGFFMEDKITPCPTGFLAWEQFHEEKYQKLFVQHPKVPDGMWVNVRSLPLMDESSEKAGAVVIVSDVTEQIKIEQEIQNIYSTLQTQVNSIETAQAELKILMTKLGNPQWGKVKADDEKATGIAVKHLEPLHPQNGGDVSAGEQVILVVDDMPVNRKLLTIQLEKLGYAVEQADDGKPAVEMIKKKKYGLVLMDLDMPELDGFQATIAIREYDRESRGYTPVVAMTSYDREGDREKCLSHGMDDYLSKGVTKKRLLEVIQRCIRQPEKEAPLQKSISPDPIMEDVVVDVKTLRETYGIAETNNIIDLFTGTMRTLVTCIMLAVNDHDAKSVNHFAYSFKGPCASIGLMAMANLSAELTADAESGNWERATKAVRILEKQADQVYLQLEPHMADRGTLGVNV